MPRVILLWACDLSKHPQSQLQIQKNKGKNRYFKMMPRFGQLWERSHLGQEADGGPDKTLIQRLPFSPGLSPLLINCVQLVTSKLNDDNSFHWKTIQWKESTFIQAHKQESEMSPRMWETKSLTSCPLWQVPSCLELFHFAQSNLEFFRN